MNIRIIALGLFALFSNVTVQAFTYQGELSQAGKLFSGSADVRFSLYDAESGGVMVGAVDLRSNLVIANGRFAVELDQWTSELDGTPLWLEIAAAIPAGGALMPMSPRQKVDPAPYASYAFDGAGGDGDITAVNAGTGLTGGAISGDATLGVDTTQIQKRIIGSCLVGESIRAIGSNGAVTCEMDTNTTYAAGNALTLNGTTFNVNTAEIIAAASDEVRTPIPADASLFTITASGSYYLTGNKTTSGSAISVESSNVTIDLNGFSLIGANPGSGRGIHQINPYTNLTVKNGTIKEFGRAGILGQDNAIILNVKSINNGHSGNGDSNGTQWDYVGIIVDDNSIIKSSIAIGNGTSGIRTGHGSIIENNVASENGRDGVDTSSGCKINGNITNNNSGRGIRAGDHNTVTNNAVNSNGSNGIETTAGSQVTDNTVFGNIGNGINANSYSNISGNTVTGNDGIGIRTNLGNSSIISNNLVRENVLSGISSGGGDTIANNTITTNGEWGIYTEGGNNISNNNVYNNSTSSSSYGGIRVFIDSQVVSNNLDSNAGTGIYISASSATADSDNVLRNNHVTDSTNCIYFGSNDNVAIGNTATGCTDEFAGNLPANIQFIDNIEW